MNTTTNLVPFSSTLRHRVAAIVVRAPETQDQRFAPGPAGSMPPAALDAAARLIRAGVPGREVKYLAELHPAASNIDHAQDRAVAMTAPLAAVMGAPEATAMDLDTLLGEAELRLAPAAGVGADPPAPVASWAALQVVDTPFEPQLLGEVIDSPAPVRHFGDDMAIEVQPKPAAFMTPSASTPETGLADPPRPWVAGGTLEETPRGVRLAREAHERLPLATIALRDLHAEVVAEDRRDVATGLADLRLTKRIELDRPATEDREGLRARLEPAGLTRLQSELRSAVGAGGDLGITTLAGMREESLREAAAATWNRCAAVVGERERLGSTRSQVVLRTRQVEQPGGGRARQVYAVVSEKYGEVDADKIAAACLRVAERVGGDMRATVAYDRENVRIDMSTCELSGEVQVGDAFRAVMRVRSNDAGKGGLHVCSVAERLACLNGAVISHAGAHTIIRHLGDPARLQERLREALAAATGALRAFSAQWVSASGRPIHDGIEAASRDQRKALEEIVSGVLARQTMESVGMSLAGQTLLEGAYRGILRGHELAPVKVLEENVVALRAAHWDSRNAGGARQQHGGLSRAALANGLTLWAQSQPMSIAHEAEVVAGRVISGEEVLTWIAAKN